MSRGSLPAAALAAGAFVVALFAAITAVQVTAIGLDENVYKFAAVQHYDDFPFGVLHEGTSRGAARLYSLLISPLFGVFSGDVAVRTARGLNGFLFAAAAVPVALVARRITASPWSAVAAGLLTIAVPWLTLATVMFSESLSYLLFAFAVLAMLRALEAPSLSRDALVIGLILALVLTRVQFAALAPAWVLLVALAELGDARRAGLRRADWRALARRAWGRHPVTLAAIGAAVALALLAAVVGGFRGLTGPYQGIFERNEIPGSFGLGLLWEVAMLSLGVGILPAVLAVAWTWRTLGRDAAGERERRFAVLGVTVLAFLFAATVWAQGGFLGQNSEERYFIYAIPLVWVAAVAAIERGDLSRGAIAAGGVAIAAVLALVPNPIALDGEQAYLGPVSLTVQHAMPHVRERLLEWVALGDSAVQGGDVLVLACLLVTVPFLLALRRRRARWLALLPAVALQLFFVGYGFAALHDELEGVGGTVLDASFSELSWIDRATDGDSRVTLLDNQLLGVREGAQRNTIFWNDEVTDIFTLEAAALPPPGFPVASLDTTRSPVAGDNRIAMRLPFTYVLTAVDSPLWQLDARRVRASPDGTLALEEAARQPQLRWAAFGLDGDGQLTRPAQLLALGGHRVTLMAVSPRGEQGTEIDLALGEVERTLAVPTGEPVPFAVDLCGVEGPLTGSLTPKTPVGLDDGRQSAGILTAVRVERC